MSRSYGDEDYLFMLALQEGCITFDDTNTTTQSPVTSKNSSNNNNKPPPQADTVTVDQLRKLFDLPCQQAANTLHIGVTVFKKICRYYKISLWPYRKLNSIASFREEVVKALDECEVEEEKQKLADVVERIDADNDAIRENPNKKIDPELLRIRQHFYKKKYTEKKNHHSHPSQVTTSPRKRKSDSSDPPEHQIKKLDDATATTACEVEKQDAVGWEDDEVESDNFLLSDLSVSASQEDLDGLFDFMRDLTEVDYSIPEFI